MAGQVAYQRDVYYRDKTLLKSVENVRMICNKLAFFLAVPPARLNIDINTRELLAMFSGDLRVSVLVDCDPDGAHIYQHFRHARWAGLHCSMARIGKWGLDVGQLIEYTRRDRGLALRLLNHWISDTTLRRRMAKMLYRGKKAELEAITQYRNILLEYVNSILQV
ncbi:hypothetical protein GGH93_003149 [Coemansia aciculifera]|nr:hypothetical protein GGH93_003149 [Coemansia aciculifera]